MSRIYFCDGVDEAEVSGSERAYAGNIVGHMTLAVLRPDLSWRREAFKAALPPGSYVHGARDDRFADIFGTWWMSADPEDANDVLTVGEDRYSPFMVSLNSAVVAGSSAVELLARMHGTCEIHGYVEGEYREWLADEIEGGREDNVLRRDAGWEGLTAMLRKASDRPVVMSYSVTETFPEPHEVGFDGGDSGDWYAMPVEERWERGLRWLREWGKGLVDISPEIWGIRGFGDPALSAFDLLDRMQQQ